MEKRKYYDKERFDKIMKHRNSNSYATLLKEWESYLEDYFYDSFALTHYLDLCLLLNQLEKMESYIEITPISKTAKIANIYHFQKIKLQYYAMSMQWEECYKLIQEVRNNPFFSKRNMQEKIIQLDFYIRFQLGLLSKREKATKSYLFQQIMDYDTQRAARHIEKHHAKQRCEQYKFLNSVSITDVIQNVQESIPNEQHFNHQFFYNQYCFKLPNNGYIDGDLVDTFTVIAINHTNSIVTMYPEKNTLNIPIIDITPHIIDDNPKVKRKSQIEKFNERYKK